MSDLKLYTYFRSSASYRVRVAIHLKGLDVTMIPVHLVNSGGEQHMPEFKEKNPMAEIPYFMDGDQGLAQSMAILQYIDEKWPNPRLFPKDPIKRAQVVQVCEMVNSGIHPIQNLKVLKYLKSNHGFSQEQINAWAHHWIQLGFESIEKILKNTSGQFCFANEVTAADLYLVPQTYNAHRFKVDVSAFPTIAKIEKNALQLDAFKKAQPESQIDFPQD